jgi:hypothetical protein
LLWTPLLLGFPLLAAAAVVQVAAAVAAARTVNGEKRSRGLTVLLSLLQPLARLRGRLGSGLTPWRRGGRGRFTFPWARSHAFWIESWRPPEQRVEDLRGALRHAGLVVGAGGDYDRWDLAVRSGALARARLRIAVEDHGANQYVRVRAWPLWSRVMLAGASFTAVIASGAALDRAWVVCGVFGAAAAGVVLAAVTSAGRLLGRVHRCIREHYEAESGPR